MQTVPGLVSGDGRGAHVGWQRTPDLLFSNNSLLRPAHIPSPRSTLVTCLPCSQGPSNLSLVILSSKPAVPSTLSTHSQRAHKQLNTEFISEHQRMRRPQAEVRCSVTDELWLQFNSLATSQALNQVPDTVDTTQRNAQLGQVLALSLDGRCS